MLEHHIDPLASRKVQRAAMRRHECGCLCKCVARCGDGLQCMQQCSAVCSSLRAVAEQAYYHEHAHLLLGAHTLPDEDVAEAHSAPAAPSRHDTWGGAASSMSSAALLSVPQLWLPETAVCPTGIAPLMIPMDATLGLLNASTTKLMERSRKLLEKLFTDINLGPGTANRTQRLLRSLERSIRRMVKLDRSLSRLEDMARAGLLYTLHSEVALLLMVLVGVYAVYSLRYSIDAYKLATKQAPVALHELMQTDTMRAPGAISVFLGTWDHRLVTVKRIAKVNMGTRRAGREIGRASCRERG